jgi:hypothetical protein
MRLCLPCCQLCLSRCGARELLQVSRSSRAPPHTQKPWGKSAFDSQPQPGREGQRLHLSKTQARNNVSCMRSEESFESVSSPIKVSSNRVQRLDPFRQLEGRIDSIECGVARRIGTVSDCMSDAGPPGGPRRRDKTPAAEARGGKFVQPCVVLCALLAAREPCQSLMNLRPPNVISRFLIFQSNGARRACKAAE